MATDPARSICAERCSEFGDPPCYEMWKDACEADPTLSPLWELCDACLFDMSIEKPEPIDPNAVIRNLI